MGAGIVGLSAAYYYKLDNPECRLLVLDRGFVPMGASTRNAGFACFGSVTEIMDDLQHESETDVKNRIKARFEGLKLLRSILGDSQIDYRPCMGYEIFDDETAFKNATGRIELFNMWLEDLTGEKEVYSETIINSYKAISNRLEGSLNSGKMMQTLIKKVEELGISIRWNSNVTDRQGSILAVNDETKLQAHKILFATNGFTSELLHDESVTPARGYVFVTNKLSDLQWKGTFHYDRGYVYFRDIDGRLLLGGARNKDFETETTTHFDINESIKKWLISFADSILKLEKGWKIDYEWTGIMGFASSKSPVIKKVDKTAYVAAGLGGMGVAIGMQIGRNAAEMLEND